MNLELKVFQGLQLEQWLEVITELRITEFQNFPYLYQGRLDIEKNYLTRYAQEPQSILVVAFDNKEIAGIATGAPFASEFDIVPEGPELFEQHKLDAETFYYCGEFILKPAYRGRGLVQELFNHELISVKQWGYNNLCLMTVDREDEHPLRPKDYMGTDSVWEKLGFHKTDIKLQQNWPTVLPGDKVEDRDNSLSYWIKKLI